MPAEILWDAKRIAQAAFLFGTGMPVKDIAELVGATECATTNRLADLGLNRDGRNFSGQTLATQGRFYFEAARRHKLNRNQLVVKLLTVIAEDPNGHTLLDNIMRWEE